MITSARLNGHDCVIGYDHLRDDFFTIDFQLIDARFPGTGDIFSAVLISDVLHDVSLHDATFKAMNVVSEMIKENLDKKEKFLGISIEEFIRDGRL